jgi:hypothetical protein
MPLSTVSHHLILRPVPDNIRAMVLQLRESVVPAVVLCYGLGVFLDAANSSPCVPGTSA